MPFAGGTCAQAEKARNFTATNSNSACSPFVWLEQRLNFEHSNKTGVNLALILAGSPKIAGTDVEWVPKPRRYGAHII